jgi:hypothetical protein
LIYYCQSPCENNFNFEKLSTNESKTDDNIENENNLKRKESLKNDIDHSQFDLQLISKNNSSLKVTV